ncbi:MAG: type II secretion system F family protein [Deltaproteobacteria bacterium]|nr:type II secretion system F family protein [Deltaproteobacteria bacterium]
MGFMSTELEIYYLLGLAGAFAVVFFLMTAITYLVIEPSQQRRRLDQRLKGNKKEQEVRAQIFKAYQESKESAVLAVMERLFGWGRVENLQRMLFQANIYLNPGAFLSVVGILVSFGFFVGVSLSNLLGGVTSGAFLGFLPIGFVRWKQKRKARAFERTMPDAMDLIARSLRAGHTLSGTLELVSQEIPPPLGTEFRITYEEQRLGLSLSEALRRMGERVASRDLRFFVTAVLIQAETGGNLAEVLENIGSIVRERLKLKGKIKALTSEGRFSAIILGALPILTFLVLLCLNPNYILLLITDPLGRKFLIGGLSSIFVGALVMKKMVSIKV